MARKIISIVLSLGLLFQQGGLVYAAGELNLANYLSSMHSAIVQPDIFQPARLRYISYDMANNDFKLLLDKGNAKLNDDTPELFNYFLIGLALPNDTFWVNLRPDAADNIIDPILEKTDIGKIFLEADLQLKKDTASLTSPQNPEGKSYWDKLYKKAGELFGTENITIPTITRPWIVPNEVIVRETDDSAYIYKATLKVMLEQDHLKDSAAYNFSDPRLKELNEYSSQIIRETIIPKLTKQVNSSKRYAKLRQVYYSLVLSRWFKQKYSSLGSARAQGTLPVRQAGSAPANSYLSLINSGNLVNLASKEPYDKQAYFQAYQKSFKDGEYNLKETVSTPFGQSIRSYISGGLGLGLQIDEKMSKLGNAGGKPVARALEAGLIPLDQTAAFSGSPLTIRGKHVISDTLYTLRNINKLELDDLWKIILSQYQGLGEDGNKNFIGQVIYDKIKNAKDDRYKIEALKTALEYSSGKSADKEFDRLMDAPAPKADKLEALQKFLVNALEQYYFRAAIAIGEYVGSNKNEQDVLRIFNYVESLMMYEDGSKYPPWPENQESIATIKKYVMRIESDARDRLNKDPLSSFFWYNLTYITLLWGVVKRESPGLSLSDVSLQNLPRPGFAGSPVVGKKLLGSYDEEIGRYLSLKDLEYNQQKKLLNLVKAKYFPALIIKKSEILGISANGNEILNSLVDKRFLKKIHSTDEFLIVNKKKMYIGMLRRIIESNEDFKKVWRILKYSISGAKAIPILDRSYLGEMRFAVEIKGDEWRLLGVLQFNNNDNTVENIMGDNIDIISALSKARKKEVGVSSAVVSGQVHQKPEQWGGIDLTDRALHIKLERGGSFASTPLLLPQVKNVQDLDLDKEFEQIEALASSGINPNSHRLLELFTACHYRGEFGERLTQIISCLKASSAIQEAEAIDSDEDFRLALMMPEVLS